MEDVVVIEWIYSPADYFEGAIRISRDEYEMTVHSGKVEAKIKPEVYDKDCKIRDVIHCTLNGRFLGVELLTHQAYELSEPRLYRLHRDGRKDVTIFPKPCVVTVSMGAPDIIITDKYVNLVSDSRKERIEKKKEVAELVEKYLTKDLVVASLLNSYHSAVNDPDNELIHMYEIRDALSKKFGDERQAYTNLGLSSAQWSRLGQLANNEPLKQGRHRGKSAGTLRDATEKELEEARAIARTFVKAYLDYLEIRS